MTGDSRCKLPEQARRAFRRARSVRVGWMTEDSNKSIFSKRTSDPTNCTLFGKPANSLCVIGMASVRPRDQDINVHEPHAYTPNSSRNASICLFVTLRLRFRGRRSTGTS